MLDANFWQDKSSAQKTIKEKKLHENLINSYENSIKKLSELNDLYQLAKDENNKSITDETLQNLKDLKLVDYKVRILNTGTEAVTRVSIESTDSNGKNWFTIGVSLNIIEASFKALVDSLDYKLFKDKAPASN